MTWTCPASARRSASSNVAETTTLSTTWAHSARLAAPCLSPSSWARATCSRHCRHTGEMAACDGATSELLRVQSSLWGMWNPSHHTPFVLQLRKPHRQPSSSLTSTCQSISVTACDCHTKLPHMLFHRLSTCSDHMRRQQFPGVTS